MRAVQSSHAPGEIRPSIPTRRWLVCSTAAVVAIAIAACSDGTDSDVPLPESACTDNADCDTDLCEAGSCLGPGYVGVCVTGGDSPAANWTDSYSVNGQCYCDTTFDHDIGDIMIDTPVGPRTVRDICTQLAASAPPNDGSYPRYNDIQCGNGPPNTAGDEDPDRCPGRVDQGPDGCCTIGPTWDLSEIE